MRRFPDTRISVVNALSSDDRSVRNRATETVIAAYRTPVIAVLERRWDMEPEDAEDLAHDFFAQALARDWLSRYQPEKGRFRTFLRSCLLAFASTSHESSMRKKRGGDFRHVSLDDAGLAVDDEVTALFDREWTRSVLALSLDALHAECMAADRESTWQVFSIYDVDGADDDARPTYAEVAQQVGLPVSQVTNYLNWARRKFREHVLATLRSLTASDDEYREEVRSLLGISVR